MPVHSKHLCDCNMSKVKQQAILPESGDALLQVRLHQNAPVPVSRPAFLTAVTERCDGMKTAKTLNGSLRRGPAVINKIFPWIIMPLSASPGISSANAIIGIARMITV